MINIWFRDELLASVWLKDDQLVVLDRAPPSNIEQSLKGMQEPGQSNAEFYASLPTVFRGLTYAVHADPKEYPDELDDNLLKNIVGVF